MLGDIDTGSIGGGSTFAYGTQVQTGAGAIQEIGNAQS